MGGCGSELMLWSLFPSACFQLRYLPLSRWFKVSAFTKVIGLSDLRLLLAVKHSNESLAMINAQSGSLKQQVNLNHMREANPRLQVSC